MNAIVAYGLAVNTPQQVVVSRSNSISVPQSVILAAAAPGIFTVNASGQGHAHYRRSGRERKATHRGCKQSGDSRPGDCYLLHGSRRSESSRTDRNRSPIYANLADRGADQGHRRRNARERIFLGIDAGVCGLYQVNTAVPSGVTPGNQVPVTLMGAGQQSVPVTIAVQ